MDGRSGAKETVYGQTLLALRIAYAVQCTYMYGGVMRRGGPFLYICLCLFYLKKKYMKELKFNDLNKYI